MKHSGDIKCVRRIQFCAGHRVHKHEGKCAHPHGHNYVAFFHARAAEGLDDIGRVIDFSVLKDRIGAWIDENWDHGFIYFHKDFYCREMFRANCQNWKNYSLPFNPTAENMARYLVEHVCPIVMEGTGVDVTKVVIWETENCYAEYNRAG